MFAQGSFIAGLRNHGPLFIVSEVVPNFLDHVVDVVKTHHFPSAVVIVIQLLCLPGQHKPTATRNLEVTPFDLLGIGCAWHINCSHRSSSRPSRCCLIPPPLPDSLHSRTEGNRVQYA